MRRPAARLVASNNNAVVRIVVHPWLPQGSALLMSYTMPFAWSNVSNVCEFVAVQDYLSESNEGPT